MSELIGYLSEAEHLEGMLSGENQLEGELSIPEVVGGGLSEEVKQALLNLFQHLAYTDADGQDYYDALYNAFYPPAELTSISAVYTQSGSVFPDTPLDDLKDDLVVTAHYSDSTTEVVPSADYTLSGTLTAGTSVITVTYEDKTTTFNVTVSAPAVLSSITAVYTQSGVVYPTDSLDSLKPDLVVTAHYSDSSTATVTTYTLSGSLTVGTSTITVTYSDKTTTFNVTVTAVPVLDSITAVYTQSGTVYDTDSLDSLKADLVVTAVYTDSSTEVVPSTDYTLSGTLTVGTSTITVSYEGETATFTVTVSDSPAPAETLWINGYAGENSTQLKLQYAPFYLNSAYYTYDYTKKIVALDLNIHTAGTLSVGHEDESHISGRTAAARENFVLDEVLTFTQTGRQKVYLNTPLQLSSGQCLALCQTTDTAIFLYGTSSPQKGYRFCGASNTSANTTNGLGIDVYVQ